MKKSALVLIASLLFLFHVPVFGDGKLSITDTSPHKVGDILPFLIELSSEELSSEWEIASDKEKRWLNNGPIIIDRSSLKVVPNGLSFEAILGDAGDVPVPNFVLREKNSAKTITVTSNVSVHGESSLSKEEQGKPLWILGLVSYGGYNPWLITLIALATLAAIFFLSRWLWKKFRASRKIKKLNAKEEALKEFIQLQNYARGQITSLEQWKVFAYKLVNILKHFCERNFEFQTADLTDRELLQQLQFRLSKKTEADVLANILTELDQVRYGTKDLEVTAAPRLLVEAKNFVERNYIEKEPVAGSKGKP